MESFENLFVGNRVRSDQYQLKVRLPAGGEASVYRAVRVQDRHIVAIKVHDSDRTDELARMSPTKRAEGLFLRVPPHENLVGIEDELFGPKPHLEHCANAMDADWLYLVLSWVPGVPLGTYLEYQGANDLRPLFGVAEALTAMHKEDAATQKGGIIHGDVKPSNILVESGDAGPRGTLIDLGSIRRIGSQWTGTPIGAANYVDFAMFESAAAPKHDAYSLARTALYCLFGRHPNESDKQVSRSDVSALAGERSADAIIAALNHDWDESKTLADLFASFAHTRGPNTSSHDRSSNSGAESETRSTGSSDEQEDTLGNAEWLGSTNTDVFPKTRQFSGRDDVEPFSRMSEPAYVPENKVERAVFDAFVTLLNRRVFFYVAMSVALAGLIIGLIIRTS